MSLILRLLGLIPISIGLLLGYGLYLLMLNIYIIFKWLSTYLNAPEAFAIVFTILVIIALFGVFMFVVVIIFYLIGIGLMMLIEN